MKSVLFSLGVLLLGSGVALANELDNGSFDAGLDGWQVPAPAQTSATSNDGRTTVRLTSPTDTFIMVTQRVEVAGGDMLDVHVIAKGVGIGGGPGPVGLIKYYDITDTELSSPETFTDPYPSDGQWNEHVIRSVAPAGAVQAEMWLALAGRGDVYFDDVSLELVGNTNVDPLVGPVTITVTEEVATESFLGFGVEDDGLFYDALNQEKGVLEQHVTIREDRIEWMDPDMVRTFFWYQDWCPSEDWQTFSFENDAMQSNYRTLDLYQRLGARINITGMELGLDAALLDHDPDSVAFAVGELLDYLVNNKGYSQIAEITLLNEPNLAYLTRGDRIAVYVELHGLVAQELAERGLEVQIVGSDDANGLGWLRRLATDAGYRDDVDQFASHLYLQVKDRAFAAVHFDDRISLLAAEAPGTPLVLTELGFRDERSNAIENPVMSDYDYAVWIAELSIEGLNHGVAGFSQFSAGAMWYPGYPELGAEPGLMDYALWEFVDQDQQVRPVYHAWANFMRQTEPGDTVLRCQSSHPEQVKAVRVGDVLFWVNTAGQSAEMQIVGADGVEATIMTEATLDGDRETGSVEAVVEGSFTAPGSSFGYVTLADPGTDLDAGPGDQDAGPGVDNDDSGCGCRLGAAGSGRGVALVALVLLLAWRRRRD